MKERLDARRNSSGLLAVKEESSDGDSDDNDKNNDEDILLSNPKNDGKQNEKQPHTHCWEKGIAVLVASPNARHNRTCCNMETVVVDQSPGARSVVEAGINGDIILEASFLP